jgi:hypothetical protein
MKKADKLRFVSLIVVSERLKRRKEKREKAE